VSGKYRFNNITLGKNSVTVDGHEIDGHMITHPVHIHWGGDNKIGPTVTLTLVAEEVTLTDEVREHHLKNGLDAITESGTLHHR